MHASRSSSPETPVLGRTPTTARKRYRAFISYSHSDAAWAGWLHRTLENYQLPRRLRGGHGEFGPLPDRLSPIFRDREDLASAGELGPGILSALGDADALIVVCSPEAARSSWVNEEILAFKRLAGHERIYSLIVSGEPNAGDGRECFPEALRFDLDAHGNSGSRASNPVAADVRPGKDGKSLARLKLISGLLGLDLDSVRQREAQRRNQRMAAITGLALLVMLVTSLLAVQAMIERRTAERRQKQAENLVGFMLGDLNDKLAQVQRLDIMESVDDQAMRYFESLPTTDVTDEALLQRATALKKIGSVRISQGRLAAALESYRAALPIASRLASEKPDDIGRQLEAAEIQAFIGTAHWYLGELDQAQRGFESAQQILLRAQPGAPDNQPLMFQLATLQNNFGHVLEARGRLDEATAQYRKMRLLAERLVAMDPQKLEWQVHLGLSHNNLGKLALMRGDLASALSAYQADNVIETRLARHDPRNNDQQEKLAIIRATLGRTLALTGESDKALAHLRESVDIARRLVSVDSSNTGFQEDLGLYANQLARLQRLAVRPAEAAASSKTSVEILSALVVKDPSNVGWQRELAEARLEQATQSLAARETREAREQANRARAMLDPLLASQPDDRATVLAVVATRLLLADLAADPDAARTLRESALLLAGPGAGGGDPRLVALQVEALLGLGRIAEAQPRIDHLWATGYRDAALAAVLARAHIDPGGRSLAPKGLDARGQ